MKRRTIYLLAVGIALGIFSGNLVSRRGKATETQPAEAAKPAAPATGGWVAGPGLVEPVSESIKVGCGNHRKTSSGPRGRRGHDKEGPGARGPRE